MDGRIEALGNRIQNHINKASNAGYHMVEFKLTREELEIISILKTELEELGFKIILENKDCFRIKW
jgi:hypothetical protein